MLSPSYVRLASRSSRSLPSWLTARRILKAYKIKLVQNNVMLLYGMFKHPWKLTQDITVFFINLISTSEQMGCKVFVHEPLILSSCPLSMCMCACIIIKQYFSGTRLYLCSLCNALVQYLISSHALHKPLCTPVSHHDKQIQ